MRTADLKTDVKRTVITITRRITKGKKFEEVFKENVEQVSNVIIERLPDQVSKFKGSKNPSDFIAYKYPHIYYFECKSTSVSSLSFDNITQWQDLLERSRTSGVVSGVVIWFYEKDVTIFVDIRLLECMRQEGYKSISSDGHWQFDEKLSGWSDYWAPLLGEKKRVYCDYDMKAFFESLEILYREDK